MDLLVQESRPNLTLPLPYTARAARGRGLLLRAGNEGVMEPPVPVISASRRAVKMLE